MRDFVVVEGFNDGVQLSDECIERDLHTVVALHYSVGSWPRCLACARSWSFV